MKKKIDNYIILLLIISSSLIWSQSSYIDNVEQFSYKDILQWEAYGLGEISKNHQQIMMSETDYSMGYMLVSPKTYFGDVTVSYDIMALNAGTVLVVELAAHNKDNYDLNIDNNNYDGNVKYLFDNVNMYMFAFHNESHNKAGPFLRKWPNPGVKPLVAAKKQKMSVGKYYHIDLGIKKDKLFFKINGKKVWYFKDPSPSKGGKIILRGTSKITASCLIKNLKVKTNQNNIK